MTPLSPPQVEREHDRSLSLIAALILAALDFFPTIDDRNAAAATECPTAEWSSLSQRSLPPAISEEDNRQRLAASSACAPAPFRADGLIAHARTRDQDIATIDAAVGQGSRADTTVNRASTTGGRTMKTKSRIPTIKISIPPRSGKKHPLRTRTTPIEIEAETGTRPSVIIGPKDQHSTSQTTAMNIFPPTPVGGSRHQPVDLSNPLRKILPRPGYDEESNRMNLTTTLALHGGDCAYGCP